MDILNLQIEIFLLILVGFLLSKAKMFSKATRAQLTKITLSIILPCAIIESFNMDITLKIIISSSTVLIVSFLIQGLYALFNYFLYRDLDSNKRINCRYATMVSNAGFMGMPIAQATFGSLGLLYASIFLIPQRIFMWSYGLSLYTKASKKDLIKKVLTHPCIIALFIGLIVMLLRLVDIQMPTALNNTLKTIGGCNTAISMIIIGGILSDVPFTEFFDAIAIKYSFIRLIVLPLIIFGILRLFHIDLLASNVCILLSAMPAASTTAMLASSYDVDPDFASKLVFVSTLISLITLPIITFIITSI